MNIIELEVKLRELYEKHTSIGSSSKLFSREALLYISMYSDGDSISSDASNDHTSMKDYEFSLLNRGDSKNNYDEPTIKHFQ